MGLFKKTEPSIFVSLSIRIELMIMLGYMSVLKRKDKESCVERFKTVVCHMYFRVNPLKNVMRRKRSS